VCYLAETWRGAFVETFLRDPRVDRTGAPPLISAEDLEARVLSRIIVKEELHVVSLRGPGLAAIGTTAAISSSPLYDESRELSREIHSRKGKLSGIEYRSRHDDDEIAFALFDRVRGKIEVSREPPIPATLVAQRLRQGVYDFLIIRGP